MYSETDYHTLCGCFVRGRLGTGLGGLGQRGWRAHLLRPFHLLNVRDRGLAVLVVLPATVPVNLARTSYSPHFSCFV